MASLKKPRTPKTDASIAARETLPARDRRVHIIGAGPVGLLLTALLQPIEGLSVHLYEKRREYTRTRMVKLSSYLVADSVESYRADQFIVDVDWPRNRGIRVLGKLERGGTFVTCKHVFVSIE